MSLCDGDLAQYEVAKRISAKEYLIKLEQKVKQIKEDGRGRNSD
jgi:hypothetical protein